MSIMGMKISNTKLIEGLKTELDNKERGMLYRAIAKNSNGEEITRLNARRILAHAMLDNYNLISNDHEIVKATYRQIVKKYMNGAVGTDEESLVCNELIAILMKDVNIQRAV